MDEALEAAYERQSTELRACLYATRDLLLQLEPALQESLKYGMPFFSYKGKVCCYFWKDKKRKWPYIGWMDGKQLEHSSLEAGERQRIAIQWLNPASDLPHEDIAEVLELAKQYIETAR